jgi:hypothetical protein
VPDGDVRAAGRYFGVMENTLRVGEYEFFVLEDGTSDGKAVLLLHGFPDLAAL